jgi:hypothetical protein
MLVYHAEAERVRVVRMRNRTRLPVDENANCVGVVISHHALHQRAFAGAVFAQQGMHAPGRKPHRYCVKRLHIAETLRKVDDLDRGRRMWLIGLHRDIDNSFGAPASACAGEEL